jgi:hypothetical protein
MDDLSRIWPRFGHDAVYVPSESGALFRNDGNSFTLKKPGTYSLICRLEPDLNGTCTLEEICGRHDPSLRSSIVWLVEQLIARGIVRNDVDRRGQPADEALRARFSSQIALLDHLADAPEERFEAFRRSRVLLVGSGISFWRCAASLIRNGLETLWLIDREGAGAGIRDVDREVEALRRDGISASVHIASLESDIAIAGPERLSLILYVADCVSVLDLAAVGRRALRESCPVLPAFVVENQSLLGPKASAPACLVCTFMRIAREVWGRQRAQLLSERIGANGGRLGPPLAAATPLASRLGSDAAFEAFKALAGNLRPEIERGLVVQTLERGERMRAVFVPCTSHWCWNVCTQEPKAIGGPAMARVRVEGGHRA